MAYKYTKTITVEKIETELVPSYIATIVTIKDVYGGNTSIPEGYKFESFRLPRLGDSILSPIDYSVYYTSCNYTSPRIIVRKIK